MSVQIKAMKFPTLGGPVTIAACAVCAACVAVALHRATARFELGFVPIFAWVWGGALVLGSKHLPAASPAGVFAGALVLRLIMVGTPLHLSDDLYRYLWEGKVLDHGINPFLLAPSSIHGIDDALAVKVNHPDIPSIYPPIALCWFRFLDLVGGTVIGAQLLTGVIDAAIAAGMALILSHRGQSTRWATVYALHPLPILESAGSAHLEPVAIALCIVAVLAHDRKSNLLAAFFCTLGFGAKLFPIVLIPTTVRRRPQHALLGVFFALVLIGSAAFPVLDAGTDLFRAGRNYAQHWSFNGALYVPLQYLFGSWTRTLLVIVAVGGSVLGLRSQDPLTVWRNIGLTFILCTPTAHPWYALWFLVPGLLLGENLAIVLGISVLGGYGVLLSLADGPWKEQAWLWSVTWLPVALFWLRQSKTPSRPLNTQTQTGPQTE